MEVLPEVAKKRLKADPVTKIRAIKDNEDELVEWASIHEELVDRGFHGITCERTRMPCMLGMFPVCMKCFYKAFRTDRFFLQYTACTPSRHRDAFTVTPEYAHVLLKPTVLIYNSLFVITLSP